MTGDRSPVVAVRPSTRRDAAALVALAAELRLAVADARGGALWLAHEALPAPTAEQLGTRGDDPASITLVGTLDDAVLGYGVAHTESLADGPLAVVDEVYVTEPARAVGLGEALLGALVVWASAQGAVGLDASALPGDRAAKNFFEAHGFTARRLVMHKPLR